MKYEDYRLPATGDLARGLDRAIVRPTERLTLRALTDRAERRLHSGDPALLEELQMLTEELESQVEHLRRERERSEYLFDAAPFACLATDREARISEANRAASTLLALPVSRLHAQPLTRFITPENRPAFRQRIASLDPGHCVQWSSALARSDGASVPVVLHCRLAPLALPAARLLWMIAGPF